jgi:hypothetical protein
LFKKSPVSNFQYFSFFNKIFNNFEVNLGFSKPCHFPTVDFKWKKFNFPIFHLKNLNLKFQVRKLLTGPIFSINHLNIRNKIQTSLKNKIKLEILLRLLKIIKLHCTNSRANVPANSTKENQNSSQQHFSF